MKLLKGALVGITAALLVVGFQVSSVASGMTTEQMRDLLSLDTFEEWEAIRFDMESNCARLQKTHDQLVHQALEEVEEVLFDRFVAPQDPDTPVDLQTALGRYTRLVQIIEVARSAWGFLGCAALYGPLIDEE